MISGKVPLPVFFLALSFSIFGSQKAHAIAGGWWVNSYADAPFMVRINPVGCGGTAISSHWILTAAHCIKGSEKNLVLSVDGGTDRIEGTEHYSVMEEIMNPLFRFPNIDRDYDNALIRIEPGIDFKTSKIKPVRLADPAFAAKEMKAGTMVTLYGWGGTGDKRQDQVQTPYLKSAQAPLQALEYIIKIGPNAYGHMANKHMFAVGFDKGGVGACGGDSGGPVTLTLPNHEQVELGVMSWGYSCEKPYGYSIYSEVSSSYDWIMKTAVEK